MPVRVSGVSVLCSVNPPSTQKHFLVTQTLLINGMLHEVEKKKEEKKKNLNKKRKLEKQMFMTI